MIYFLARIHQCVRYQKKSQNIMTALDQLRLYPIALCFLWTPVIIYMNLLQSRATTSVASYDTRVCFALLDLSTQNGTAMALIFFSYSPEARQRWAKLLGWVVENTIVGDFEGVSEETLEAEDKTSPSTKSFLKMPQRLLIRDDENGTVGYEIAFSSVGPESVDIVVPLDPNTDAVTRSNSYNARREAIDGQIKMRRYPSTATVFVLGINDVEGKEEQGREEHFFTSLPCPAPSSSDVGAPIPCRPRAASVGRSKGWQVGVERERENVQGLIVSLLMTKKPNQTAVWIDTSAKRAEEGLFVQANSLEEYSDPTTLTTRVEALVRQLAAFKRSVGGQHNLSATPPSLSPPPLVPQHPPDISAVPPTQDEDIGATLS